MANMEFASFKFIRQLVQFPSINAGEETGRVWPHAVRLPESRGFKTQTALQRLVDYGLERTLAQREFLTESFGDLRLDRECRSHADILHHETVMSPHLSY
jgi:hypothetical protein